MRSIRVERTGDNGLKISDDGRGIPLTSDPAADKAVLEELLAGRPLTAYEYRHMGDPDNLTLQTVNALCENFCVTVYRDGKCFRQDYVRGIAQHELYVTDAPHGSGMEIAIKPDAEIFGEETFQTDILREWIKEHTKSLKSLDIDVR